MSTAGSTVTSASASTSPSTPSGANALGASELDALVRRHSVGENAPGDARAALPRSGDPYFRAWAIDAGATAITVPASFSVVVVTEGAGALHWTGGTTPAEGRRRTRSWYRTPLGR